MQTSHGFEERISGMDDAMEPTLEILTTSLPATRHTVICKLYSTLYSVSIHYKNLQHHLRRAAKLPSTNVTGKCSWILQHTGFVIMNYSLKCAMHKDLSQQTNCISTAAASAISHNTIVVLVQVCWPLTILIWQVFRA